MNIRYYTVKNTTCSFIAIIAIAILSCSCSYEFPEVPVETNGSLNDASLDNTVFIGTTLFSGANNGSLTTSSLQVSIPQILLNNINRGSEEVNYSAHVDTDKGFNIYENSLLTQSIGAYKLVYAKADTNQFKRSTRNGTPFQYSNLGEDISNYSFPKAQLLDFTETNRAENAFVNAFNNGSTASLISSISSKTPSFFVMDLGTEDLLGYAINGGTGNDNQIPANHQYGDILNTAQFQIKLNEAIDALLTANPQAKGALINIPDFLKFPFFVKVGYDITPYVIQSTLPNTMRSQASAYNNALIRYYRNNPGVPTSEIRPFLDFGNDSQGNWGTIVTDDDLSSADDNGNQLPKIRHALMNELIFYSNENKLDREKGQFPGNALGEADYLKRSEIAVIQSRISTYNQIISDAVANSNGKLVLIDINSYFKTLFRGFQPIFNNFGEGTTVEGATFLPTIQKFGIFSADGLNLNPRGNALIADFIVKSLNSQFSGSLRGVNANDYAGTPITVEGGN